MQGFDIALLDLEPITLSYSQMNRIAGRVHALASDPCLKPLSSGLVAKFMSPPWH